MDVAIVSLIAAVLSALIAGGTTVWRQRRSGPNAAAALTNASGILIEQLQRRVAALELRVQYLEEENDRYYRLHGPLPASDQPPRPTRDGE